MSNDLQDRRKRVAVALGWTVVTHADGNSVALFPPKAKYSKAKSDRHVDINNTERMWKHLPQWGACSFYGQEETPDLVKHVCKTNNRTDKAKLALFVRALQDVLHITNESTCEEDFVRMLLATPEQLFEAVERMLFPQEGQMVCQN